ncbi:MAG: hypothetical protein Q7R95_07245 [bacterium]|nr:hypothetical protein [bacterium]
MILDKLFNKKKVIVEKTYSDYSPREKKKIIVQAARKANKLQYDLVQKYKLLYCKTK